LLRVLLAQKDSLWRGALAAVLSQEHDLRVLADMGSADHVLTAARRDRPNLVVLDVPLPGSLSVIDLCTRLYEELPECRILLVLERAMFLDMGTAVARLLPRIGMIAKDVRPDELIEHGRRLVRGEPVLDATLVLAAFTAGDNPLTIREREVLRGTLRGAPVKDIAAELFLSVGTVRNYLAKAVTKTGGRTRIEAIRIARDEGWI